MAIRFVSSSFLFLFPLLFFFCIFFFVGGSDGNIADCLHLDTPRLGDHVRVAAGVEGFAVIMQTSFCPAVPFVIHRFISYLPAGYKVILLTSSSLFLQKLQILDPILAHLNVTSYYLPPPNFKLDPSLSFSSFTDTPSYDHKFYLLPLLLNNMTVGHYNCQLLHPDFYNNIPVENLLIFQSDSLVLTKDDGGTDRPAERRKYIRDFYRFAYIGAPWRWRRCQKLPFNQDGACRDGGNGGLSYRRVADMKEMSNSKMFAAKVNRQNGDCSVEDITISDYFNSNVTRVLQLAPREQGKLFSAETMHAPQRPWGFHKVWAHDGAFRHSDVDFIRSLHLSRNVGDLLLWASKVKIPSNFQAAVVEYFGHQDYIPQKKKKMIPKEFTGYKGEQPNEDISKIVEDLEKKIEGRRD